MQKSINLPIFFLMFICFFSTSFMFTMDRETEEWTRCNYGHWFDKNKWTQDFKAPHGKICCRTHKPTLALGTICCIASNIFLPCHPSMLLFINQSSCLVDQVFGLSNQSSSQTQISNYRLRCCDRSPQEETVTIDFRLPLIQSTERK